MSNECNGCFSPIVEGNTLHCSHCKNNYHDRCITVSVEESSRLIDLPNWVCPNCKPKIKTADNTPVRSTTACKRTVPDSNITHRKKGVSSMSVEDNKPTSLSHSDVRDIIKGEIKDLLKHLDNTMATFVNNELKSIKEEIVQVNESMKFMNSQYEEIKLEITKKFATISELQKKNSQLESTVSELNLRLNLLEQQARSANIEIQCLPEFKGENLVSTVVNIGKVISCKITENNIHQVTRIAKRDASSKRPKSIVVQFNSPRVRDEFLAASIKYNKANPEERLSTKVLGIGGNKENVYVVEHLSPANKQLHAAARTKAKQKGYQYVWIRNGRVYMRKNDGADYKYIKDISALNKIE